MGYYSYASDIYSLDRQKLTGAVLSSFISGTVTQIESTIVSPIAISKVAVDMTLFSNLIQTPSQEKLIKVKSSKYSFYVSKKTFDGNQNNLSEEFGASYMFSGKNRIFLIFFF